MNPIRLVVDRGARWHPGVDSVAVPVHEVRRLEAIAMASLPEGTLMQRAAAGIAVVCTERLVQDRGGVYGSRVVLLVGSGDNGGDALYAGARLARRGARVDALLLADRWHVHGARALRAAGGWLHVVDPAGMQRIHLSPDGTGLSHGVPSPYLAEERILEQADLVVDGVLGIGGHGGLRGPAAALVIMGLREAYVIAVDLPSGLDADTGAVQGVVVRANETVVLGVLKPGLLVGEGALRSGRISVVDIGLDIPPEVSQLPGAVHVVDQMLVVLSIGEPYATDDKYSRGVVGISAGSPRYPGAALLSTGAARHGAAGMVRYAGPSADQVVGRWPEVVAAVGPLSAAGRVQCWVVGPGRGTDADAVKAVREALAIDVPVVLDADALTVLAEHADLRALVADRSAVTVLTPHAGEFMRLCGAIDLEPDLDGDRLGAVRALAEALGVVVLLKGSTTVVAAPEVDLSPVHERAASFVPVRDPGDGPATLVTLGAPPELATAGSGDVLAGLLGSLLAHEETNWRSPEVPMPGHRAARVAAVAAYVHGIAGQIAAEGGRTVAAMDVLTAIPDAIARVRAEAAEA